MYIFIATAYIYTRIFFTSWNTDPCQNRNKITVTCFYVRSQTLDFNPIRNLFCYWPQVSELDGSLGPLTKWDTENIGFIKNELNKNEEGEQTIRHQEKKHLARDRSRSRYALSYSCTMFSTKREDHPIKTLQNDGCFPVRRDSTLLTVLVCTAFAYAISTLFCPFFVQEPLHLRIKVHENKNEITCTAMRIGSAIFLTWQLTHG